MEIETKYNIGDKVWLICGNKAVEKMITQIDVAIKESEDSHKEITYRLNYESIDFDECRLFDSKEELLKSL